MLLLLFQAAGDLFAIEAKHVVEVIPRVELRPVPHAPLGIGGLLNYRGAVVPVIDVSTLLGYGRCREALSTRIIVVRWETARREQRSIGLIAENVIHLQEADDARKRMKAASFENARYLGSVYQLDRGLVQIIRIENVLDDRLEAMLFSESVEPSNS